MMLKIGNKKKALDKSKAFSVVAGARLELTTFGL